MTYEIDSASLDWLAAELPETSPVFMLNLLRFQPNGGREAYFDDYLPAFRAIAAEQGIEGIAPVWTGNVASIVAGADEEWWDTVLVVRYPSLHAFRAIAESARYRETAAPYREAALRDWRLVAQTEMVRPD